MLAGRRIPSKRQGRRREIDLIVCTPRKIHLIEVKNWSGQLTVKDGRWRQTRRSGEIVDHGDMFRENRLKQEAVVEYLRDRGLDLGESFVRNFLISQVIFTNPKLELDSEVERRPDVISRRELDGYVGPEPRKGFGERMMSSLIDLCMASVSKDRSAAAQTQPGRIPPGEYEKIVVCLLETETWDQLHYQGTTIETGDLISLRIGSKTYRKADLVKMSRRLPIRLQWTRGRFWGLWKALTGLGSLGRLYLGNDYWNLATGDTVMFHGVGDVESRSRRLVDLDQIVLG